MPLQRGDFVVVRTDSGRELEAMITLATPNGRSIILMYDGMIGGWVGAAAAFLDDAGAWALLDGMPIVIIRNATMDEQRAALVQEARRRVQAGEATHDCGEWNEQGRCALCDRQL